MGPPTHTVYGGTPIRPEIVTTRYNFPESAGSTVCGDGEPARPHHRPGDHGRSWVLIHCSKVPSTVATTASVVVKGAAR